MGRDHSIECEDCGAMYGGFNGPDECGCAVRLIDVLHFEAECAERLDTLASNLATAAALCRAFSLGADWNDGVSSDPYNHERYWFHGCGKEVP